MGDRLVLFEMCPLDEGGGKRCWNSARPLTGTRTVRKGPVVAHGSASWLSSRRMTVLQRPDVWCHRHSGLPPPTQMGPGAACVAREVVRRHLSAGVATSGHLYRE